MEKAELFKIATKEKYRFPFKGLCTVEDLWDLSALELDVIYGRLKSELKASEVDSLVSKATKNTALENKIEIVSHIFAEKEAERNRAKEAAAKRAKKEKLLSILAEKQEGELKEKSAEEIAKMIDELGE